MPVETAPGIPAAVRMRSVFNNDFQLIVFPEFQPFCQIRLKFRIPVVVQRGHTAVDPDFSISVGAFYKKQERMALL